VGAVIVAISAVTACAPREEGRAAFMDRSWSAYKQTYLHADGYVLDPGRGDGEVTSEGQGYALLRAAWLGDRPTFDRVLDWTERHLRRGDGLFSWRWSPKAGGRILDPNTASDADQEIAFALILASRAFHRAPLADRARELLESIRAHESLRAGEGWFPAAGNWALADRIVNLSYFLPYAYPYFARLDPQGDWAAATRTGYALIASVRRRPGLRLIPDFMTMTEDGEAGMLPGHVGLSGDFSSDAMRLYFRVALDCQLHRRTNACADPLGATDLTDLLARDGRLFTRYRTDGSPLERSESISFYAIALPFLQAHAPAAGQAIRHDRLSESVLDGVLSGRQRYYDANWVWFGLAAADDLITTKTNALWPAEGS
jgi:endo-1,4-beta-D-glucanase Y